MSYTARVFNVLIASPSDVQAERGVAREVISDWNASHSSSRRMIFQPIGWETHSHPTMGVRPQEAINKQILSDADLVIAIFWTRIGTSTGHAISGTVEELREHMKAGKPAMVYFSSAPVRLDSVDDGQYKEVISFREECKKNGLIEVYDSLTEFRTKLVRHLASMINSESYFLRGEPSENTELALIPTRDVPTLSKEAAALLAEAAKDRNGAIVRFSHLQGLTIQSNGKEFAEPNPRSEALWEGAINELEQVGFIATQSAKREVFRVTREGYEAAEELRA